MIYLLRGAKQNCRDVLLINITNVVLRSIESIGSLSLNKTYVDYKISVECNDNITNVILILTDMRYETAINFDILINGLVRQSTILANWLI